MSRILVVDDDPHILRTLQILLDEDGHHVLVASSAEDALELLTMEPAEIALVDLQLPGMSGLELLARIKDEHRATEVIIITAHGSIANAVEAMKEGAFDYLTKPFSPHQVRHRLEQIVRVQRLEQEVAGLRLQVIGNPPDDDIVSHNSAMRNLIGVARSVAANDVTVLLTGESGTGKSMIARLLHRHSLRQGGPFAVVNCATFHESLLESELFGHVRGSFTGATSDRPGKVESADKGTLFLDEVGEIPLHLQGKLLRLVEERTFERLGESRERRVNTRIVAATNRDLSAMVSAGEFREDLFYRLSVVDLAVPALRHRPEDILDLARTFLDKYAAEHKKLVTEWDEAVEQVLLSYPWPGNVRELANALQRAVLLAPGRTIRTTHLPERLNEVRDPGVEGAAAIEPLAALEERAIRRALLLHLPVEETAERLGISPATLWRKRKKLGL